MKNSDMPASPMHPTNDRQWTSQDLGSGYTEQCRPAFGLTKREHAAVAIMAGIASSAHGYHDFKFMAQDAIYMADALLKELEVSNEAR